MAAVLIYAGIGALVGAVYPTGLKEGPPPDD